MALIEVQNLSLSFQSDCVLNDISFDVNQGEVLAIIGPSGSGKTTLLKCMTGMLPATSGIIAIKGESLGLMNAKKLGSIRRDFGFLFQNGALFASMTVHENVSLPLLEHTKLSLDVIDSIMRMKLEMVGLSGSEQLMPSEISGGMIKRVGLARAIALDPEILFCDEPGSGLDPVMAAIIDNVIVNLSKKLGITCVVVTHNMESAFRIADRVIMLYDGGLQVNETPQKLRTSKHPVVKQFIEGAPEGPITEAMPKRSGGEKLVRKGMR